jgi:hypothetical protein
VSSLIKFGLAGLVVAFGVCAFPNTASATSCPASPAQGDNVYTVTGTGTTGVGACVSEYGNGNLNGTSNDDFLNGPNDASPADDNTYLGGGWTSFCSTGDGDPSGSDACKTAYNFTFTNAGGTSGTWSFTGSADEEYALGVKDGGDPFWAVFLLTNSDTTGSVTYSGTWSILNGGLSHFVIYDRDDLTPNVNPETPVPEPASLLLLGSGLALAGKRFRNRRRQAQSL